jgi:hypothetical protein
MYPFFSIFAHNPPKRRRSRRAIFLTWLRKIHLYVGLWGAMLGLLFGASGILLNHRAILKIPVETSIQRTIQLTVPTVAVVSPQALSVWLQQTLSFIPAHPPSVKSEPAKKVAWATYEIMQPERWQISLQSPYRSIKAEYFVGNRFVHLEQLDATPIGTLTRLHKAVGVNIFWVLLSDTIAGSLIVLSLTGLLLWTQLHTLRTIAVLSSTGALLAAFCFMWSL